MLFNDKTVRFLRRFLLSAGALLFVISLAALGYAYLVGPSLKLEELKAESDVIFKAQIVFSNHLKNSWFEEYCGFDASATEMQIVSIIKGEIPEKKVVFQHYREVPGDKCGRMFSPQYYNFQVGRSYLIFAKKTDQKGIDYREHRRRKRKNHGGVWNSVPGAWTRKQSGHGSVYQGSLENRRSRSRQKIRG